MIAKLIAFLCLLTIGGILSQQPQLTHYFSPRVQNKTASPTLATITALSGSALYFDNTSSTKSLTTQAGQTLHHLDQVETASDGSVVIRLNTGDIIELGKLSRLQIETLADQSILLSVLNGRLYVQQSEKDSSAKIRQHSRVLGINELNKENFVIALQEDRPSTNNLPTNTTPPADDNSSFAQKIQEVMEKQKYWLDKCYSTFLKKSPHGSGEVQVLFSLDHSGKVEDARVKSSTINDETMENCVLQIVKRASFAELEGESHRFIFPFQFNSQ